MPFRSTFELVAGSILAEHIAVGAITSDKIANGAITAEKILDGTITGVLIADGAVTANKVAAQAITAGKIQVGAVGNTQLADDAVTAAKILNGEITGVLIADGAVTANKVAAQAITAGKIQVGAVGNTQLADDAVTAAKILNGEITGVLIADGAVTATKIAATAIDGKTITGALVRTAASGTRAEMSNIDDGSDTVSLRFRTDARHLAGTEELRGDFLLRSGSAFAGEYSDLMIRARNHEGGLGAEARLNLQSEPYDLSRSSRVIIGQDLLVDENLTVTLGDIKCDAMAPMTSAGSGTFTSAGAGTSSAAANAGAIAFVAPRSGRIMVNISAAIRASAAGTEASCGFEIRNGSVLRAGTVWQAYDSVKSVGNWNAQNVKSGGSFAVSGLTPGAEYNAYHMTSSGAAGCVYFRMEIEVIPLP